MVVKLTDAISVDFLHEATTRRNNEGNSIAHRTDVLYYLYVLFVAR